MDAALTVKSTVYHNNYISKVAKVGSNQHYGRRPLSASWIDFLRLFFLNLLHFEMKMKIDSILIVQRISF